MKKLPYPFESIVWQYSGPNGWYFVTLPQDLSGEIRSHLKEEEQGWEYRIPNNEVRILKENGNIE